MGRVSFLVAGVVAATVAQAARAQVTAVVTRSDVEIQLAPGFPANPSGFYSFSGLQLEGVQTGGEALALAGYQSVADVGNGRIEFANANYSFGPFAYATSRTTVEISFTNDAATAVIPSLVSSILPAGFGLFSGVCGTQAFGACSSVDIGAFPLSGFERDPRSPLGAELAGTSFLFRVSSGGQTLYELSAALTLVESSGGAVVVRDIAAAEAALNGFTQVSPNLESSYVGYAYDLTPIVIQFPASLELDPGESATLTYELISQTFSRATCIQGISGICVTAYGGAGDPVARGGGVNNLEFAEFSFEEPMFEDGVLGFRLAAVPEPASWALMVAGFGAVGVAIRRRPALRATAA